jgi:CubicO group peptidase (beta-lactamase class C family)
VTELSAVTQLIEKGIDTGLIPGAIVEVRHRGEVVHSSATGVLDTETGFPLRTDTILWLASLSKVAGAVAVMMLADDGRLDLADPVSAWIPEFGEQGRVRVLHPGSPSPVPAAPFAPPAGPPPVYDIVPADRELTLFDLLTHTGGLQSIFAWNPEYRIPAPGATLADYVPALGGLVRDFQAGAGWAYSNAASYDVLSRVIEIVSGQDLEAFLRQRIFEPLGVSSIRFGGGAALGAMPIPAPFLANPVLAGRTFQTTSAGLWGTAHDYLTLAELLRAGGVHAGTRLLSLGSAERMATNQLGDLCPGLNGRPPAPGVGMGLAVAVITDPGAAGEGLPSGAFGWDGVATRRFWVSRQAGWSLFMYMPDQAVQREIEAAVSGALAEVGGAQ